MRNWTEKHIRELVRGWYGSGGVVSLDPSNSGLNVKIENVELHQVGPMLDQNDIVQPGSISKIEMFNIEGVSGSGAYYQSRQIIITGNIPSSEGNELIIRVACPMRGSHASQSVQYINGEVEHGPFENISAPFTGRLFLGSDALGNDTVDGQNIVTVDGVYNRRYKCVFGDDGSNTNDFCNLYSGQYGENGNPFGLISCDLPYALGVSSFSAVCGISLSDTPACNEILIHTNGYSRGQIYNTSQASLVALPEIN